MKISLLGPDGKRHTVVTSEVVVLNDHGQPLAIAYETQGAIVHSNAAQQDWPRVCAELRLIPTPVQVL